MNYIDKLSGKFPRAAKFLQDEKRKTSLLQDMIICAFAALAVSFYYFEYNSAYFFADGLRAALLVIMLAAWFAIFFVNGVKKRFGILIFGAAYWLVPLIIITVRGSATYSLLLDVLAQYSELLVRYPLLSISEALTLPYKGVILLFLLVLTLGYFAGVCLNAVSEKN